MTSFVIITIFEALAVVAIIIGLLNEKKLIAFEDRLGTILGTAIGRVIRKHLVKKGR
jgi:hypothetical protein